METFANKYSSTVATAYTAGSGTLEVASDTGLPATGTFRLRLGNPAGSILICTARVGTTLTVTPEEDDGDASIGDEVRLIVTAGAMEQLKIDAGGGSGFTPVVPADFAWINQGGATDTFTDNIAHLVGPPNAVQSVRQRVKTAPATPFTLIALIDPIMLDAAAHAVFIHFRESATGKIAVLRLDNGNFQVTTGTGAFAANQATSAFFAGQAGRRLWMRLTDAGGVAGNLTWAYSHDGVHFKVVATRARNVDFTTAPDQIGYGVNEQGNARPVSVSILSWAES